MATTEHILSSYQRDQVNLASPEALTLMLYRAALKSVGQTKKMLGSSTFDVFTASQLARDIFLELADNVNTEHPHAASMRDLYLYCWRIVIAAPSQANPEAQLASVEAVLQNLIEGLEAFIKGQTTIEPAAVESKAPPSLNFVG